jgi:hypothetical protein
MIPSIDLELELENEKVYVIVHYFPEVVGPLDTEPSRISIISAFRSGEDEPMSEEEIQKIREDYESDLHEMADDLFNEESANWDGEGWDSPWDAPEECWPEPMNEWDL